MARCICIEFSRRGITIFLSQGKKSSPYTSKYIIDKKEWLEKAYQFVRSEDSFLLHLIRT